jgi:hypothetical protein
MTERTLIQNTFIRVAQDSGFALDPYRVAHFTANLLNISAFAVAFAFSDLKQMESIARGEHPAAKKVDNTTSSC